MLSEIVEKSDGHLVTLQIDWRKTALSTTQIKHKHSTPEKIERIAIYLRRAGTFEISAEYSVALRTVS